MTQIARRVDLPIDRLVYADAGREPEVPIAWAGNRFAPICCVGRDLGREEVRRGQPLVGPAGQRVRELVLKTLAPGGGNGGDRESRPMRERALDLVFVTNLVPYKPPANRAYAEAIVERFRPLIAQVLVDVWRGAVVLALGREAVRWFDPYVEAPSAPRSFEDECADEHGRTCLLVVGRGRVARRRRVVVFGLPHPSPANVRWAARFGDLLQRRLRAAVAAPPLP
jgi:uracil-DNA glycosylase